MNKFGFLYTLMVIVSMAFTVSAFGSDGSDHSFGNSPPKLAVASNWDTVAVGPCSVTRYKDGRGYTGDVYLYAIEGDVKYFVTFIGGKLTRFSLPVGKESQVMQTCSLYSLPLPKEVVNLGAKPPTE
jgi:hypothetical protein